jgi:ribosomal protein L3
MGRSAPVDLLQVKTEATDGYNSVQVGYRVCKEKTITKPQLNHLKKFGAPPMRKLKEYRVRFHRSAESQLSCTGTAGTHHVEG